MPNDRMYSLGVISGVEDIGQIETGEFEFDAFKPRIGEGFVLEIQRDDEIT